MFDHDQNILVFSYDWIQWVDKIQTPLIPKPHDELLRVEIPMLINAMDILITKGLLVVITYHLLPKDEVDGIS
jgi:hypothetical protein